MHANGRQSWGFFLFFYFFLFLLFFAVPLAPNTELYV